MLINGRHEPPTTQPNAGLPARYLSERRCFARRSTAGFTLIEVLIALLVLSIGLLGLAALQSATLQFNHSAYLRSQATNLAYDMIDRMRANRQAALNGAYDGNFAAPAPACGAVVAGGAAVADIDIAAWRNALACSLPAGTGFVAVAANGVTTVSVRWDESRAEQSAAEVLETLVMTTVL